MRLVIKKELKKNCRKHNPVKEAHKSAFLLQTYWQLDAILFLRQESAYQDSLEQKPLSDPP